LDLNRVESSVPGPAYPLEFCRAALGVGVLAARGIGMRLGRPEAEQHQQFARLAGGELEVDLHRADHVLARDLEIAERAAGHRFRLGVAAVVADEELALGLEADDG